MTVQEALQNIDVIVSNVPMKRGEHQALQQSVNLIAQRCQLADRLEKTNQEAIAAKKEEKEKKEKS